MTIRLHRLAALVLAVFPVAWPDVSGAGNQDPAREQEPLAGASIDALAGETVAPIAGMTETVGEIMARAGGIPELLERAAPPVSAPAAALKQPNPLAPAVSRWPMPSAEEPGAAVVTPGRLPQTPGTSFTAVTFLESGAFRPDTAGDVGPTQVLVATNGRVKVFDRAGNPGPLNVTSDQFFQSVRTTSTTDLHVRYDRLSGRWFVTSQTLECPDDFILIAVSSGPTITDTTSFTFYRFLAEPGRRVEDQSLGLDANAVYVGGQMFNCGGQPVSASAFVIRKSALLAGTLTMTAFRSLANIQLPQGVDNDDPAATQGYFVGTDSGVLGRLQIVRVTGPGTLTPTITQLALNVPATAQPIDQPQPGGPLLAAGGDRLLAAAIRRNKIAGTASLWTAHAIQVDAAGVASATGGRNGVRWYEISGLAATPALVQAGTLFDPAAATPFGYWIPSVASSGQGHMALGANRASASAAAGGFASIVGAGRLRTDAAGATQAATLLQGSTFTFNTTDPAPEPWGRSSQTVVDPLDDQTMWTFQEYVDATDSWAVRAVQLRAPAPVTPAVATPSSVPQGVASVDVIITGTSVAGTEYFDPGPDTGGPGYPNRISAAVGGGVTVNSTRFDSPTQVTLNVSTMAAAGGPQDVTITNPDGQSATGTGLLTVVACPAITVEPATVPPGATGTPYSQTFTQTGGTPPVTIGLAGSLPAGLTFDGATGVLSGTPVETGSFPFTVTATDANNCTGSRAYTLVIGCGTITVTPATIPNGTAGSPYSQTFAQTGGIGTITWSLSGTLPTGLTFDTATGVLSGTPMQTGSFAITVTAADANGCIGSRPYTLVIDCQTITVTPATIPNGTAGTPYSQTFAQTGGIGTITWSLSGTLPTGLTFDTATGVLSGTPTQLGSFPITVTAADANACAGSRQYTLVVNAAGPFVPTALAVDQSGNRVFEAGETAVVAPTWRNDTGAPQPLTGTATLFAGPGSSTYTIADSAASYGAVAAGASATCSTTGDCYAFNVSVPSSRPTLHWDSTYRETLSSGDVKTWTLHLGDSFADVPRTSVFYRFVETLLHKAVTGGCASGVYCPVGSTLRDQMAVFVLVAKEGPGYTPPACTTPVFTDVPAGSPFCRFVEELARRGVVTGCAPGQYCPASPVTREQMAVFALRTLEPTLSPPACTTPMFNDVPASNPFCRWIEELARRGVVTGCGGGNYCPAEPVTREQMGVFITATFGLMLYGV